MDRIADSEEQEESEMVSDRGDKHGAEESERSICEGEENERRSIMCVG